MIALDKRLGLWIDACLCVLGLGCALAVRDAVLSVGLSGRTVLDGRVMPALCVFALTVWVLLLYRLTLRMRGPEAAAGRVRLAEVLRRALREEQGSASVSFVLTLPIFLIVLAVIIQSALLVNASLVVNHAAFVSARSAIVEKDKAKQHKAAAIVLSGISPRGQATTGNRSEGRYIYRTLRRTGVSMPGGFVERYGYASVATKVTPDSTIDFYTPSMSIQTSVEYKFKLTVPGASAVLSPRPTRFQGSTGRFVTIPATCELRASPGRQFPAPLTELGR